MTDDLYQSLTESSGTWGIIGEGVKYFFAPASGDDQFFASLDLYEPFDEDKDEYDYHLIEITQIGKDNFESKLQFVIYCFLAIDIWNNN